MRIELITEEDSKLWNDTVNNSINGTLYHCWDWLKIAEKHSGSKLFTLIFFDANDDKPFGAIPLFQVVKFGLKMVFSPPPGTLMTLGPVIINKGYKQHKFELTYLEFQAKLDQFINDLGSNYTFILTSPGLFDIRPFTWAHYEVAPCYTYKIDLSQGGDIIWKNLSSNLRTNIRNAQKRGIQVIENNDIKHIDYVYNSISERYFKKHINPPFRKEYLHDLFLRFGLSDMRLLLATYQNSIVGSSICISDKDTMIAWGGGGRSESNNIESNELLMWESINKALQNKYKWFELAGANTQGICNFKSGFDPSVYIYYLMKKTNLAGKIAEKAYMQMRKKLF
jgi:hypothetical protein